MSLPPLHIALISEEYPPLTGWGGIGTYTYNLARGLTAAGHRVEVVAGATEAAFTQTEGGMTLHRIGFAPPTALSKRAVYGFFQMMAGRMPELRRRLEFAHAAFGLLRRIHRDDPFQIGEAAEYGSNGYYLARAALMPMVVKIHTPTLFNYRLNEIPVTREVRWCDRFERKQTRLAAFRTAPSRKMTNLAATWLGDGRPIEVLPNPIDTEEFQPGGTSADAGCDYLFYTGRLERRKGAKAIR